MDRRSSKSGSSKKFSPVADVGTSSFAESLSALGSMGSMDAPVATGSGMSSYSLKKRGRPRKNATSACDKAPDDLSSAEGDDDVVMGDNYFLGGNAVGNAAGKER